MRAFAATLPVLAVASAGQLRKARHRLVWPGRACSGLVSSGVFWPALAWSGLVWPGLVSSGLVWSGLVWSGMNVHALMHMKQ